MFKTKLGILLIIAATSLCVDATAQEATEKKKFQIIRNPVQRAFNPDFQGKPEQEIELLEHQLSDAFRMKDWSLLDKLLSDNVLIAGVIAEKASYVALLKQIDTRYASIEKSEMRIRIYGDVAVVSGIQKADIDIEDGARMSQTIFLNTWKKINGTWRCIAMAG